MNRIIAFGIALVLVVALSMGCGIPIDTEVGGMQPVHERVPLLSVTLISDDSSEQSVQALQLTGSWTVNGNNGNSQITHWDSAHALQIRPIDFNVATLYLSSTSGEIKMLFSDNYWPTSISVQRWNAEYAKGDQDISDVMDKGEPVEISEGIIRAGDDGYDYVYEIYAVWTEGNSYYTFRVESSVSNRIEVDYGISTKFSEAEIRMAAEAVLMEFESFEGCDLKRLWYDEVRSNREIEDFWKYMDGIVRAEDVIVFLSDFYVDSSGSDGSLNPDYTYTNWMWILIRDSENDAWKVDDWGY